jgi:hypothetical protein
MEYKTVLAQQPHSAFKESHVWFVKSIMPQYLVVLAPAVALVDPLLDPLVMAQAA